MLSASPATEQSLLIGSHRGSRPQVRPRLRQRARCCARRALMHATRSGQESASAFSGSCYGRRASNGGQCIAVRSAGKPDVPGMCRVAEACGAAWSHQQLEVRLSSRALVQACLHTGLHTPCARGAPCHLCSSAAQDELVRDMSGVLVAVRDAEVQGFAVGWRVADELQARPAASNPPSGASHAQLKRWSALKPGSLFSRLHTPHHALHPPVNS